LLNYFLKIFDFLGEQKNLAIEPLVSGFRVIDVNQIPDIVIKEYHWDRLLLAENDPVFVANITNLSMEEIEELTAE
jgi:hypothetical protein